MKPYPPDADQSAILTLLSDEHSHLGRLIQTAQRLSTLNETLQTLLDTELKSRCQVSHYDQGILYVVAESSAWATRLRFCHTTLLSRLRQDPAWCGIKSLQVRVRQPEDRM